MSQQLIKSASGVLSIDGVLLNGLALNAFHNPESTIALLISSDVSPKSIISKSSLLEIFISID